MANPLFNRILNKLRKVSFSQTTGTKLLTFGAIYLGTYSNYKQDKEPLIWIQWSDANYTHGINLHYLSRPDREWFTRTIYLMAKGKQSITPRNMYLFLKSRRPSIVKKAYRKYFTSLLNMRLVSAGITNMHSLVYTNHREGFIHELNKNLKPSEMGTGASMIAYSSEELQERIIQSSNTFSTNSSISSSPIYKPQQSAPYTNKAPWLKS